MTEIHTAADALYNQLFELIEADDLDDACAETFPGGEDGWFDATAKQSDAHYEQTLRLVCARLSEMFAARARGERHDGAPETEVSS